MVLGCKKVLKMALNDNLMTTKKQLLGWLRMTTYDNKRQFFGKR